MSGSTAGQFFSSLVKVTYNGTVYHAIQTGNSGGIPDNGVFFRGTYYNCSPIYVDATYVSNITAYNSYDGPVNISRADTNTYEFYNNYTYMGGSLYVAGTYYDYANTSYYVKPSGTSYLNTVQTGALSASGGLSISGGNFTMSGSYYLGLTSLAYTNVAVIVSNWPGAGAWGLGAVSGHILKFDQTSGQAFQGATDLQLMLGTYYVPVWGRNLNAGTMYSTVYYDAANTGYYVQPSSASNLNTLSVSGTGTSLALTGAGSNISFLDSASLWTGYVGYSGTTGEINFSGRNILISSGWNSNIQLNNGSSGYNSGSVTIPYGTFQVQGAGSYAPTFYDYNNSSYYVTPSSTTNLNNLFANGYPVKPAAFNNYALPNTNGSSGWVCLGTFYTSNSGEHIYIKVSHASGYNASDGQNGDTHIHFKTSNGSSNNGGFYGDGYVWYVGSNQPTVYVSQINISEYQFWMNFGAYTGSGSNFFFSCSSNSSFAYNGTNNGSTAPTGGVTLPTLYNCDSSGNFTSTGFLEAGTNIYSGSSSYVAGTMYDNSNTSFYVKPSGTSTLSILNILGYNSAGSGININWPYSGYVNIWGSATYALNFTNASSGYSVNLIASGNITAYSDIRLKENIEVIPNALDKVQQLRGVTYNRSDDPNKPRHSGVIAQEVMKVLPEVVTGTEDTQYSVAYGNMVGLLIEAIKELNNKIEILEEKLNNG
jgi:hypothetical protein